MTGAPEAGDERIHDADARPTNVFLRADKDGDLSQGQVTFSEFASARACDCNRGRD